MTPNTTQTLRTAPVAQAAASGDRAVAAALRDVAFVLQLTRKVKAEILGSKPGTVRTHTTAEVLTAVSA